MSPPFSGSKEQPELCLFVTYFDSGFLLGLFFDPEDGGGVSPKGQKVELFRKFLAFQSHLLILLPSPLSEFEPLKLFTIQEILYILNHFNLFGRKMLQLL
jgi:hypothetical protein